MGNSFGEPREMKKENLDKTYSFGSYKNASNPRPGYFVTKDAVYYRGTRIDADPSTFVKLKKGYAKDKKGTFFKGERV